MPKPIIHAFSILKKSAAKVNIKYNLKREIGKAIMQACDEIKSG